MKKVEEYANAKINLTLDVGPLRKDGYHEMESVMISIGLRDVVELTAKSGGNITLRSNFHFLPTDGRNLAVKAANVFFEKTNTAGSADIRIHLNKSIPVCAGMGGGSSDAAAVLRGLNRIYGTGLSDAELEELGRFVGSDVAFCVTGKTCLATGRGDILSPLPSFSRIPIVVCKPDFFVSTPELFSKIDRRRGKIRPDTPGMVRAITDGDLEGVSRRIYNVFEEVLSPYRARTVGDIRRRMLDMGALGACMTGTGPTVFGIFAEEKTAKAACGSLSKSYRDVFFARSL